MSQPEFDRFAKDYDKVLGAAMPEGLAEDSYFSEYKVALMAQRLAGRPGLRILDFGCGAGRSLQHLQAYFPGAEIWGYDVSPPSLVAAAERAPGVKLTSDWAFADTGGFDAILAANVFHHIPTAEQAGALRRCHAVLKNGGALFLFEHNPYNPMTRWVFEHCPFDVDARMISLRSALALARGAGFRSCRHGYTLFFPRPLAAFRPLEPLLRWLPLGAQYYVQMGK